MTLQELGVFLRTEREKRGHSINEVAANLKISPRLLRALEEGDGNSLPHMVYVRGFVRSYALFLGIDEEEAASALDALEEGDIREPSMTTVYAPADTREGRGARGLLPMVALTLCLAAGILFWVYRDADFFSESQQLRLITAQPAPPAADDKKPAPALPEKSAVTAVKPAPETPPAPQAVAPRQESAPPSPIRQTTAPSPDAAHVATERPAAVATSSASTPAQPAGHHKIIITALAECWIHSSADSSDIRQFSLRKGDTFALTFSNNLVLKLGNAGGVRIRYDGVDMPAPGKDGQVKTLTFPPPAE